MYVIYKRCTTKTKINIIYYYNSVGAAK